MDGIYYKEWSAVLDRAMEFKRYGHSGVPVLALPARGGRFYDWENNGMPEAVASLLHAGKVQLFCADSIDGESLLAGNSAPRRRKSIVKWDFLIIWRNRSMESFLRQCCSVICRKSALNI